METQAVTIQIFGRTLKFNCPVDEVDALNNAARDLDLRLTNLREKSPQVGSDQLIMTAALNISYELTKEKEKSDQFSGRLKLLQQLLDSALNSNNESL
ncbi:MULTISPECIES: cell division protein ZapA [unclassified Gilliamella]|uniref:cell division protein ZapA n=1 Tax=unclassified Gilliamella TaxID=2685620 RepID=UPI00080DCDF8|nr:MULTISPECIES: cell division protein ZapA [Gilliamella]MCX8574677.1 cell division protein ZapA [Gilliamella sp. B3831]MCX8576969.1 cell division protein ZapA [Gilliamella sp. B3815]MCX8579756.1 cell division protein ZapA [Gilliamella sp. B2717]MCX8587627.1 cell division protein ZapA [Gilliamella sp. B3801]MCX8590401.1 cell division protein ZapA [Gilliamella sp. B3812]